MTTASPVWGCANAILGVLGDGTNLRIHAGAAPSLGQSLNSNMELTNVNIVPHCLFIQLCNMVRIFVPAPWVTINAEGGDSDLGLFNHVVRSVGLEQPIAEFLRG